MDTSSSFPLKPARKVDTDGSATPIPPVSQQQQQQQAEPPLLLQGLKVYIIHVKDDMTDGPAPGVQILRELEEYKEEARLGVEFHVTGAGESYYL